MGLHPTQKPLRLLQALIALTTCEGQLVLDPFAGSGSTLVAAQSLAHRHLGFEAKAEYVAICRRRLGMKNRVASILYARIDNFFIIVLANPVL